MNHVNDEYDLDPGLDLAVLFPSLDGINYKQDYRTNEEHNKETDEHISQN